MGQNRFTPIRYDLVSPTNLEYRREYAVYVFFPLPLEIIPLAIVSIINNIINKLYNTRSPGKQNFTRYHRSKFQTRLSKIIGVFRINIIRHLFARVGLFRIVINLSGISIRWKGVSNSLKNREKKMRKF